MATAMTAGATVSGTRAFIAAKHFSWVTPRRLKAITIGLMVAALSISGLFMSGTDRKQPLKSGESTHAAEFR
jgi:hypothetical protein